MSTNRRPAPGPGQNPPRSARPGGLVVPPEIGRAIIAAVARLESIGPRDVAAGREVDRDLRRATAPFLERTGRTARVVALARIACAQLAVGDVDLALPALRDARDLLR